MRNKIVDSKICDLEHYIEHNNINTKGCYRIVKEMKKCTLERRKIKNDMEIAKTLNVHLNKLISIDNRKFLEIELRKTNGRLNQPYKNRIYEEKELKELVGVENELKES